MRIQTILEECSVGDAATTEGVVKWKSDPRHVTGNKNGKDYDFWGQFVVIDDEGQSLGLDMSFPTKDEAVRGTGIRLKVKGTVAEYQKDGETRRKLKPVTVISGNNQPAAQQAQGKAAPQGDYQRPKSPAEIDNINRTSALDKAVKVMLDLPDNAFFDEQDNIDQATLQTVQILAGHFVRYIQTGVMDFTEAAPDYGPPLQDDGPPRAPEDEDIPF